MDVLLKELDKTQINWERQISMERQRRDVVQKEENANDWHLHNLCICRFAWWHAGWQDGSVWGFFWEMSDFIDSQRISLTFLFPPNRYSSTPRQRRGNIRIAWRLYFYLPLWEMGTRAVYLQRLCRDRIHGERHGIHSSTDIYVRWSRRWGNNAEILLVGKQVKKVSTTESEKYW